MENDLNVIVNEFQTKRNTLESERDWKETQLRKYRSKEWIKESLDYAKMNVKRK